MKNITYLHQNLKDVQIAEVTKTPKGKDKISLKIGENVVATTPRFWRSFGMRFGVHSATYRHFSHDEVFARVHSKAPEMTSRFAIDLDTNEALAVSSPDKDVIHPSTFMKIVDTYGGDGVRYNDGQYEATFKTQTGARGLKIGSDDFETRYTVTAPIDGFQSPIITLSLLRLVCMNGMVAAHKYFSSLVNMGGKDSSSHTLDRAVASYDNEKGYDLLASRLLSAQKTTASHAEVEKAAELLVRAGVSHEAMKTFRQVAGSVVADYNLISVSSIEPKRLKLLSARCSVYDLLNMMTEITTHHLSGNARRMIMGAISTMITQEYDFEGLENQRDEHQGMFFDGLAVIAAKKRQAEAEDAPANIIIAAA